MLTPEGHEARQIVQTEYQRKWSKYFGASSSSGEERRGEIIFPSMDKPISRDQLMAGINGLRHGFRSKLANIAASTPREALDAYSQSGIGVDFTDITARPAKTAS